MNITYIKPSDGKCSECGKVEELRPYGKNGAFVCFDCAMKDEEEATRQFKKILDKGTLTIDVRGD